MNETLDLFGPLAVSNRRIARELHWGPPNWACVFCGADNERAVAKKCTGACAKLNREAELSKRARNARDTAKMRRDIGIERSAKTQGEAWATAALSYVVRYTATHRESFLCEDVRNWAAKEGFTAEQPKAWGQVMQTAARRGIVKSCGYAPADSSNGSPKVCWIAT